jgi:Na+/H+ antiporter NhaD/arsenite permease-like protein
MGTLAVLMVGTMLLSNVVNNAAAAVLMAPIAITLAEGMAVSVDPLLMAVAVGASCAFLTPVGHQSNALVMAPGGYRFGDYWRLGLPLSVLVTVVAVPLILYFWPMQRRCRPQRAGPRRAADPRAGCRTLRKDGPGCLESLQSALLLGKFRLFLGCGSTAALF